MTHFALSRLYHGAKNTLVPHKDDPQLTVEKVLTIQEIQFTTNTLPVSQRQNVIQFKDGRAVTEINSILT